MSEVCDRRTLLGRGACLAAGVGMGWLAARIGVPALAPLGAQEDRHSAEEQLKKLKLELPKPGVPKGLTFVPAVRVGETLYVSGHTPSRDGKPIIGKVGKDLTVEEARDAARLVGLIILGVVRAELGSLDRVVRLVKVLGMVNCTPDFKQQPQVINGFSNLMVEVFGEKAGKGARSSVGMSSLPNGVPVEVEAIFQVKAG
jgi:enamine deaminase RidA (YjgF/YER057c/UK114 family)